MINQNIKIGEVCDLCSKKTIDTTQVSIESQRRCPVCRGLRLKKEELINNALQKINQNKYEWDTFWIGLKLIKQKSQEIEELRRIFKKEFKKELLLQLEKVSGKRAQISNPDLFIIFSEAGKVYVESRPIYIEGNYTKLVKYISQIKWICPECNGSGCFECDFRGRHFATSIGELLEIPLKTTFLCDKVYLHAGGREDVDVLVLEKGRPFVVEIRNPKKKLSFKLEEIEQLINDFAKGMIEVKLKEFVAPTRKSEIKLISEKSFKKYVGIVKFSTSISSTELLKLSEFFNNKFIEQRTPLRVLQRRSDILRKKLIKECNFTRITDHLAKFEVVCEGGTYIKEFINGDDGRTSPSVSEVLGTQAMCAELQFVGVCEEK